MEVYGRETRKWSAGGVYWVGSGDGNEIREVDGPVNRCVVCLCKKFGLILVSHGEPPKIL